MAGCMKNRDRVRLYVENQILAGLYPVGKAIPSIRALARKFRVGNSVAQYALKPLIEEGLLENRPQRGFFVVRRFPEHNPGRRYTFTVFLKTGLASGSLIFTALQGVLAAAEENEVSIRIRRIGGDALDARQLRREAAGTDGVLLLHSVDRRNLPELPMPCPVAGLLAQYLYGGTISAVNLDLGTMAELACRYFDERGIRHVEIYTAPEDPYVARGEAFLSYWEASGGSAALHRGAPSGLWEKTPGVGYFFTSDGCLGQAWQNCLKTYGETLPERHVMLGVDGKRLLDPDFPEFPTIGCDYRAWGKLIFEELLRRVEDPLAPPRNIGCFGKVIVKFASC